MDIFSAIRNRHSTRKYLDKEVDMHDIAVILEAGRYAPTAGNLQHQKFIVVKDRHSREALSEACQKQHWMNKAPVHIVVTANVEKVRQFYGIRGERLYAIQDCAASIENMLLTATALGISSCWVGYFDEEKVMQACGIPGNSRPQAIITLGYEQYEERTDKNPLHNFVFFERFGNRIENVPKSLMGDWSDVWQQHIEKGKRYSKKLSEHLKRAHSKVKEHIDRLRKR